MLALAFICIAFLQISNGHPLETAQPQYEVNRFHSSRIVGGIDAPDGHSKHMVSLIIGNFLRLFVCGGSIISKRHILSAAHCIEPFVYWDVLTPSLIGVVGSKYWNSTETEVKFSGHRIHPDWSLSTQKNDIGILITANEIQFNAYVGVIGLGFDWISGGHPCSVAGWGRLGTFKDIPHRLKLLYINTITAQNCLLRMDQATQIWGPAPRVNPTFEICTLHSVGHGMCNGDSGSALVCEKTGKQVGVVSWGFACALGAPDIFARISAYKEFLLPYIEKSN